MRPTEVDVLVLLFGLLGGMLARRLGIVVAVAAVVLLYLVGLEWLGMAPGCAEEGDAGSSVLRRTVAVARAAATRCAAALRSLEEDRRKRLEIPEDRRLLLLLLLLEVGGRGPAEAS